MAATRTTGPYPVANPTGSIQRAVRWRFVETEPRRGG